MKKLISKLEKSFKGVAFLDSCVTVNACESVRVENCKRVLECNEMLIRIKTTDCDVSIWGEGLYLECYNESIISVFGKITSVEFEANKK